MPQHPLPRPKGGGSPECPLTGADGPIFVRAPVINVVVPPSSTPVPVNIIRMRGTVAHRTPPASDDAARDDDVARR